jgi:hypothetical protein
MLYKNVCFCTKHKSSVSTCFAGQIMPILHILCCNGCLVTWTVVSLTTAKFKPLIFSVSGFTLSYTANMFILMIPYDFCLFSAQFCYIIIYNPLLSILLAFVMWPRHGLHRKRFVHYCTLFLCRGSLTTELFSSNGCCTVACLHSFYLAMGLHVTVLWSSVLWMRVVLEKHADSLQSWFV